MADEELSEYFDTLLHGKGGPAAAIIADRDKGSLPDLIGKQFHVSDFAFLVSETADSYAVFLIEEDSDRFYFGGLAISDVLQTIADDDRKEEFKRLLLTLVERKSKKGRMYFAFDIPSKLGDAK